MSGVSSSSSELTRRPVVSVAPYASSSEIIASLIADRTFPPQEGSFELGEQHPDADLSTSMKSSVSTARGHPAPRL
jgi:hypothetical protein